LGPIQFVEKVSDQHQQAANNRRAAEQPSSKSSPQQGLPNVRERLYSRKVFYFNRDQVGPVSYRRLGSEYTRKPDKGSIASSDCWPDFTMAVRSTNGMVVEITLTLLDELFFGCLEDHLLLLLLLLLQPFFS
jgi:hypothetical protein